MPSSPSTPDVLDAYRTTGTSPGGVTTVHLLGPGAVGRRLLELLAHEASLRVVGVSDRRATVWAPEGLDARATAAWKADRGTLEGHELARVWKTSEALGTVGADIVVDATSTDFERRAWPDLLHQSVLSRGGSLVFASKDAPARCAHTWLSSEPSTSAVGIHAVLGGTGEALRAGLDVLRSHCTSVAIAGSASTTALVDAMASGATFEDAVEQVRALQLLETDPELDFRGLDAAVKLAVAVQALWGWTVAPGAVPCQDIRDLDPAVLRASQRSGLTTRLVARSNRDGDLGVAYEALPAGSPLAVPQDRVAYVYELLDGVRRVHVGAGLGAAATARALLADVRRLAHWRGRRCGAPPAVSAPHAPRDPLPAGITTVRATTGLAYLPVGLTLERGGSAPNAFVAFEATGPTDAPVVVVLGGISADRFPAAGGAREGWWASQVGEGRAIDPARCRVVGLDWLGGNGASWGPRTVADWDAGLQVTTADQARGVAAVLDALGVARAAALVGASYGGMVGLRFASLFPDRVGRVTVFGAAHEGHPMATAVRSIQRRLVRLGTEAGRAEDGVALARALGMTSYRSALEFAGRFGLEAEGGAPARFPVDEYLDEQGRRFGRCFHPDAYVCLSESVDLHAMDAASVSVPLTAVAFDTDTLVPPWTVRSLALGSSGTARHLVIPTKYGHDGFLKETGAVAEVLREDIQAALDRQAGVAR